MNGFSRLNLITNKFTVFQTRILKIGQMLTLLWEIRMEKMSLNRLKANIVVSNYQVVNYNMVLIIATIIGK